VFVKDTLMQQLDSSSFPAKQVPDSASISELAMRCQEEMESLQRGDKTEDASGLQLLSLARLHNDEQTWNAIERCFSPVVRSWIRRHPRYEDACRVKSERRYVILMLAKFRHGVAEQGMSFPSLTAALRYLLVCVNSVLLDTLRSAVWLEKIKQHELLISNNTTDRQADAALLPQLLSDEREQRLAYLLFHCGLSPQEIAEKCSSEFSNLQEIYQLRSSLMKHLENSVNHEI
jgi:hypothetical protein